MTVKERESLGHPCPQCGAQPHVRCSRLKKTLRNVHPVSLRRPHAERVALVPVNTNVTVEDIGQGGRS